MWTNYYFVTESIDAFYFVNNVVVCKALLVKGKGGKLVYKIFIVNVVFMHLPATDNFDLFKGYGPASPRGLMDWATVGVISSGG